MLELFEIELSGEFNKYESECVIQAIFNDFIIKATIEADFEIDRPIEEEVGVMSDSYQLNGVEFFNLGITDKEEEVYYPSDELILQAKQEIENHFNSLVQNF